MTMQKTQSEKKGKPNEEWKLESVWTLEGKKSWIVLFHCVLGKVGWQTIKKTYNFHSKEWGLKSSEYYGSKTTFNGLSSDLSSAALRQHSTGDHLSSLSCSFPGLLGVCLVLFSLGSLLWQLPISPMSLINTFIQIIPKAVSSEVTSLLGHSPHI